MRELKYYLQRATTLTAETSRLVRAVRSFGKKGQGFNVFNHLLSTLFMRSFDRAENIYIAMRCRGFDGTMRTIIKFRWSYRETLFIVVWIVLFTFFRFIGF